MTDRLDAYRSKRDFGATPEPGPGEGAGAAERRAIVHQHHARRLHWDLRLERDGVLVSWAVPKGMPPDPKRNHLAVHAEDHPIEYIDFSGEIPEGEYGAGKMEVWDERDLRDPQVPQGRGDGHLPRRAPQRPVRLVPHTGKTG